MTDKNIRGPVKFKNREADKFIKENEKYKHQATQNTGVNIFTDSTSVFWEIYSQNKKHSKDI